MKLWKWLTGLFFLLAVFDGALRKWVFPGQSLLFYLLKDVILAGAFALFVLVRNSEWFPRPIRGTWFPILIGLYVYVVLLQAFNFVQPNLAVRLLGLKAHLAYLPLVILLPALLAHLRKWTPEQFILVYMGLVALPVMLLGIYQFFQPTSSWVNQYVSDTANVSTVAGRPRITGSFAYMNGMSAFMLFNTILGFGVVIAGLLTRRRMLTWGGAAFFGVCLVVLPMIGSRGPVLILGVLVAGIGLLLLGHRRGRSAFVLSAILVGGLVIGVATQTDLDQGWMALQERAVNANDDASERIENTLLGPLNGFQRAGLLGYGVGTFHQAAPRLVQEEQGRSWIPGGYVENGVMRLVLELGGFGWLVLLALKGFVAWMAYEVFHSAESAFEVIVGIVGLGKGVTHVLLPVVFTVTMATTYWTVVGFLVYTWSCQQVRGPQVSSPQQTSSPAVRAG